MSVPDGKEETPRHAVLTNNAGSGELGLDTGPTYTAVPAFTNPPDAENKRLIDSDKPVTDWNTVAGINNEVQTVIFDLKKSYPVDEIALRFIRPQRPAAAARDIAGHQTEIPGQDTRDRSGLPVIARSNDDCRST